MVVRVFNKEISSKVLDLDQLRNTIKKSLTFQSPFVRKIFASHEDKHNIFVIVEDLSHINFQPLSTIIAKHNQLDEQICKIIILKILIAVNHIHSYGF